MLVDSVLFRQGLVVGSALLYWSGVLIHASGLRRRIGRSPNIKPRGLKESLLWGGWLFVIVGWIGQPFVLQVSYGVALFSFIRFLSHPLGMLVGAVLALCGHLGTLWCYATMGDSWRIGIDRSERTALIKDGPYQFVRHPIYLFQIIILMGMLFLLPTPFSCIVILVHFICVTIKAADEETYLMSVHGLEYRDYLSLTGRLFPQWNSLKRIVYKG